MSFILERLVNCGIHFIYDLRRDFHITPYRWRLGWLSVENRRMYFLGIMAYRVDHHLVPSYICDFLSSPAVDPRRSSRLPSAASVFHIPLHRTTVYCHSFCYLVAYFWKSLFFILRRHLVLQFLKSGSCCICKIVSSQSLRSHINRYFYHLAHQFEVNFCRNRYS